jgi:indolepyruvate ferredoxin oxidoreductase
MTLKSHPFSLENKYLQEEGTIILSGVQALVRLPLDQHRADKRAGLNTATFISGYRGSPVGGLDVLLQANKELLDAHQVVFMPGVNEDLGATAVWGSQMANLMPQPKYDGVLGMWYGKAPGVDRSGDVFKHANFFGVGRTGGVLAIAGDDPMAKSSTLPSGSEVALYDAQMPVLYPGNVQEIIEYGRYGFELSRYSGLWVGLKLVTNVADAYGTAVVQPLIQIERPEFMWHGRPWQATQNPALVAPFSLQSEQEIHDGRLKAAQLFAAANQLNRITVSTANDWLGIVAPGKSYYDVREALYQLGLDDAGLRQNGIRLLKIGMVTPLEPEIIRQFARGLRQIIVIEEKRAFLELFIRDALYSLAERPSILGKTDESGHPLVPGHGELDADLLLHLLHKHLSTKIPNLQSPNLPISQLPNYQLPITTTRSPYFCSGCPHNRSTRVPDGSLAGGGIGCHGMALTMGRQTWGITQMGGEGAQWVGASFFSQTPHLFQNLGDGTLFHSGYLAIRQAVAAGTNITYKILYNTAVAMTGGQPVDGAMPVPELSRALQAEGVSKIIVCAEDTGKYPANARWADGVDVWPRERLDEAQERLRDTPGVTVLIYDQPCAADLRRKRKRGEAPDPAMRVFINQAVCEGCGDCGVKSNCLSVFPVETEYGRKTQIHQSSCNKDYTCLEGDCPAFVTVIGNQYSVNSKQSTVNSKESYALRTTHYAIADLPEPTHRPVEANIYMTGIGGTGVVTVNQILVTAATLEGKFAQSLDQTGLSQKGGPVVSHLKVTAEPRPLSNKVGRGQADAYLVFDVLTGTMEANLSRANPERTVAVVSSSQIPTGKMVADTAVHFPQADLLKRRIEAVTQAEKNVYLDAIALSEKLFGSHLMANMMVVGAAYQTGLLPMSAAAIEQAIVLNGASVKKNQEAFGYGRLLIADPQKAAEMVAAQAEQPIKPALSAEALAIVNSVGAEGELRRLLEIRVPELIAYQNVAYAREYAEFVKKVLLVELELEARHPISQGNRVSNSGMSLSEAVARYLFKLMAYKDEYEVARLSLKEEFRTAVTQQFGPDAKISYRLHPPFLRALGLKKKISLGRWFDTVYRLLYAMRRLRGTPLDFFGYAQVRRVERELIGEYRAMIEQELENLTEESYGEPEAASGRALQLAQLPDMIRGYEHIKLNNVARFREASKQLAVSGKQ